MHLHGVAIYSYNTRWQWISQGFAMSVFTPRKLVVVDFSKRRMHSKRDMVNIKAPTYTGSESFNYKRVYACVSPHEMRTYIVCNI